MKSKKFKVGDWILHKTETGKVWKLCEITKLDIKNQPINVKNLKAKKRHSTWHSDGSMYLYGNPIIIPVSKNSDTKNMSMQALITLYGSPKDKNLDQWTFFEKAPRYNIQINSKNKKLINKILKLAKQEDIELVETESRNTNIDVKYILKENK